MRPHGTVQVGLKKLRGDLVHLEESGALLRFRIGILGALRHGDAVALRYGLEGLEEGDAFQLHHELEDVAARAAPEAFIKLVNGIHSERRRLLGMERAQADVAGAGLFDAHVFADEADDVHRRLDLFGEIHSTKLCSYGGTGSAGFSLPPFLLSAGIRLSSRSGMGSRYNVAI